MKRDWLFVASIKPLKWIAQEVASAHGVPVTALRGARGDMRISTARREFYRRALTERPDLSSGTIGRFINRDGSTIRIYRREMEAKQC